MSKILIVYYSKSGHTEQIAKEMAKLCNADLEMIQSKNQGDQGFHFLRALLATGRQQGSAIEPQAKAPGDYDIVVVGTPVWMFKESSFAREYLNLHTDDIKRVAFFCTEGGSGDAKVFEQMSRQVHLEPLATLVVTEKELSEKSYLSKLETFVSKLDTKPETTTIE